MKTLLKALSASAVFGAAALVAHAQPTTKLVVVDMLKLYNGHYDTQAMVAKTQGDAQKAQDTVSEGRKELDGMVAKVKDMQEQLKNPALTADAKTKINDEGTTLVNQIQAKQQELQGFAQNAQVTLQQRMQTFQLQQMETISKLAVETAKKHGATLVLDKSAVGATTGVPAVLYSDAAYDITDEVMAEINKGKPADMPAPSAGQAPAPAASSGGGIKVPDLGGKH